MPHGLHVDAIREHTLQAGLIKGLAYPITARVLSAMHANIARSWRAVQLARLCGCSCSAFDQRFTMVVGVPPMTHLQRWRIAVAKDELRGGQR